MMHTLKRILETVLISSVVFVALERTKSHMPADLRDAMRDTGAIAQASAVSLSEVAPNIVAPAAPAAPKVKPGSDRAAYVKDAEGEKDVFISEVYADRKLAQKTMAAAVKNMEAGGKRVLFAALLKQKAGGDFYVIRLDNSPVPVLPGAAAYASKDEAYAKSVNKTADEMENNCREIWN